ncbi:hypothetical protein DFH11DRAFT_1228077 [Phellopilus nigrolimitatus]|nr:hypothetical protein DFH11DRAFT_1228077 [Phellopilus nigrolimitatus]
MSYRVFLIAPTTAELKKLAQVNTYHRKTASSSEIAEDKRLTTPELDRQTCIDRAATQPEDTVDDWILPPATLDAASQRISEMYQNIIFADEEEEQSGYEGEESGWDDSQLKGDEISHASVCSPPSRTCKIGLLRVLQSRRRAL